MTFVVGIRQGYVLNRCGAIGTRPVATGRHSGKCTPNILYPENIIFFLPQTIQPGYNIALPLISAIVCRKYAEQDGAAQWTEIAAAFG